MERFSSSKKVTILLTGCMFFLTSLSFAESGEPPKELAGMLLKEDAKVDLAYVRQDVDWKKYKTVYIRKLDVTDEAKDATPAKRQKTRGHLGESWIIPEKDIELMKVEFTRIMTESLEKEGIKVVTEVASDTLVIVPSIVDIYLQAPIEKTRRSHKSRGETYTDGGGSMTLTAAFADGADMRVLAYAVDNKYPSSMWSRNTRIQNISDMKRLFRTWGKMLGKKLNKMSK